MKPPVLAESEVSPQVCQALEMSGAMIFRNNVGCAKHGNRWVRYGVGGNGGSDFIGYLPVRITQDMVGQRVAVFIACETKRSKGGKETEDQKAFVDNVVAAGGIAGFIRSWEQARQMITSWHDRFVSASAALRIL